MPEPSRRRYMTQSERITIQLIHWLIVLVVIVATTILALKNQLDHASVTALFGTVLGHAGTAASQKLGERSADRVDDRR
jgi:hypothetical protein